eukprot:5280590-Amphidinium_carterae.1
MRITFLPRNPANVLSVAGRIDEVTPLGVVAYPFDFTDATLTSIDAATILARTTSSITISIQVDPSAEVTLVLGSVHNPTVSGAALMTITTYDNTIQGPETRVDENKDLYAFDILGYIDVFSSSTVNPFYFNSRLATVTFELECNFALLAGDVLRVTRPPGWTTYAD